MAYKDSLFRSLFNNEKAALGLPADKSAGPYIGTVDFLEPHARSHLFGQRPADDYLGVYNALHGTDYNEQDAEVVINTLGETLVSKQKNDISFLLNRKLVLMVEHQSTINENMPFRFLQPIARIFENGIPEKKAVFWKTLIKLPRPEFIVLYNGTEPLPDRQTLRLSDAYETVPGFDETLLELEVKVWNVNESRNAEMVSRCAELQGYAYFVARVRFHESAYKQRNEEMLKEDITRKAIQQAIRDCKANGFLVDYWENLTMEEINMLETEWDINTALEVAAEENFEKGLKKGREEGWEKGREKGREEIARNALAEGATLEFVQKITGLDLEAIKNLQAGGE